MIELLERADPAVNVEVDKRSLRSRVDERVGLLPTVGPAAGRTRRPLLAAVGAIAAVAALVIGYTVFRDEPLVDGLPFLAAPSSELGNLPGIATVVPLRTGGVKTMAVDGVDIWVMEALHNTLTRVNANTGSIEATFPIDEYSEGIAVGAGFVWLLSYDEGGEVLRFDPAAGRVDRRIPINGEPAWGPVWFGDRLWVSNDRSELHEISPDGKVLAVSAGDVKGEGLGLLWVNDPETGLIHSIGPDGRQSEYVIPTHSGLDTADGWGVREVVEADSNLWLMDGGYPFGTDISRFDPGTGELRSFASLTFGLMDMTEYEGSLWVTSHTDHLLIRVDLATGEVNRYPLPGKAGGLAVVDGTLWVSLYHPGVLVGINQPANLIEAGEIVADDWNRYPHRLLCTGQQTDSTKPTIIMEPAGWIGYGQWSVVQAQLSAEGYVACVNGYVADNRPPDTQAADLEEALVDSGIDGPYVMLAAGDGVHAARLFADGRSDVVGAVFVDPIPIGFASFLDAELGFAEGEGHPPWLDIEQSVSASLSDFGDLPLVVIGHDLSTTFKSGSFVDAVGETTATAIDDYWQEGLDFYSALSTNSRRMVANNSNMDRVVWDQPALVELQVLSVIEESRSSARVR